MGRLDAFRKHRPAQIDDGGPELGPAEVNCRHEGAVRDKLIGRSCATDMPLRAAGLANPAFVAQGPHHL
jgi:hypothetical protein